MPERSGTTPGQEITPGIRIRAWEALKTIKNDEKLKNFEIHQISHEMHSPVDFLLQIFKFPMLTYVCGLSRRVRVKFEFLA